MESFLESVERQAYRAALLGTGKREDALDVVQDAMLRFVENYSRKPRSEWKPLFYKVLYSQISTMRRKRALRSRWFSWLLGYDGEEDPIEAHPDGRTIPAEKSLQFRSAASALEKALQTLSERQQQAFLLRGKEELSVAETAMVMQCSESSVKTHYARALEILRVQLGDHWP